MKHNFEDEFMEEVSEPLFEDTSDLNKSPNLKDFDLGNDKYGSDDSYDLYGDNEVESDNSRWELDPDDVFNRIEHLLRSERISKDGKRWIKVPGVKPLVNERGLFEIMRDLNLYINKNTVLANLDQTMLNRIMRNIGVTLVIRLKNGYKDFEIEKHNLSYIQRTLENEIYIFLTRALGGVERKIRRDKYKLTETQSNQPQQGMFASMFQGKKKTYNF